MVIIVIHVIAIFDAGSLRFAATSLCTDVLLDCPKMCHKFNPLEAGAPSARFTERLEVCGRECRLHQHKMGRVHPLILG